MRDFGPSVRRAMSAATAAGALGLAILTGGALALPGEAQATAVAPSSASTLTPSGLQVLAAADAQRYREAFSAMRRGDFIGAENAVRGVTDPCLMGRLQAVRLLHPAYRATYAELAAWLERNPDLPEAARVYDLAIKHKPAHAPAPRAPTASGGDSTELADTALTGPAAPAAASPRQAEARAAFYKGDVDHAFALATTSGEHWIAGLSAMRLKRYPDALQNFSAQASDARQSPWGRAASAFWASRAAAAVGDPARAHDFLRLAARSPDTFYGMIAQRELDQQAAKAPATGLLGQDPIGAVLAAAAVDGDAMSALARSNPAAKRAAALIQIGMAPEAGEDMGAALAKAAPADRPALTAFALALDAPLTAKADVSKAGWARFDFGHFPTPLLQPQGGFTIDKALVYALVNQESKFNPGSISSAGAYGLMQLTAETAARLAGDENLRRHPGALTDPALNLRLGQAYVAKLLSNVKGDVIRAVAAYNCGPGVLQRMTARMGGDMDSLLMIESLPNGQTRAYVQRVMAAYWIYRQIFGQDSHTLDAAAAGLRTVASADR